MRWAESELYLCCTLSYQIAITSFWTDGRSEKRKKGGATPTDKMVRFHSNRLLLLHHPQIISRSLFLSLFSSFKLLCVCLDYQYGGEGSWRKGGMDTRMRGEWELKGVGTFVFMYLCVYGRAHSRTTPALVPSFPFRRMTLSHTLCLVLPKLFPFFVSALFVGFELGTVTLLFCLQPNNNVFVATKKKGCAIVLPFERSPLLSQAIHEDKKLERERQRHPVTSWDKITFKGMSCEWDIQTMTPFCESTCVCARCDR